MAGHVWTPEELQSLKKVASKPWSAIRQAKVMTRLHNRPFTRNMVLGKIHREGLRPYSPVCSKRSQKFSQNKPVSINKDMGLCLPLSDIDGGQCRYPVIYEKSKGMFVCGMETNKTYCDYHHEICHVKKKEKD